MKLALIVTAIKQAGPVKVVEALVNYLVEYKNIQVNVYCLDNINDKGIHLKVDARLMDAKQFPFEEFDIIHTHGIRPDLFAFIHRKRIKYHISTIHNFVFKDLEYTYNRLISIVFGVIWFVLWSRADKLVCVSYSQKKFYSKWINPDKLFVIHNGISEYPYEYELDSDIISKISDFRLKGLKIIGTASAITRGKGLEQVMPLLAENKKLAYIVIGEGKALAKLKKTAKQLNILDQCYFPGFRSQAISYFKHFDLFIMSSRSEGFCISLVEAVAQKVPVICSDIEVFRELFTEDEVTFFKVDDLSDLKKAFNEVNLRGSSKTDQAYKHYKMAYTGRLMAAKYSGLYSSGTQ